MLLSRLFHRFSVCNICPVASSVSSCRAAAQIPTKPSWPVLVGPYLQIKGCSLPGWMRSFPREHGSLTLKLLVCRLIWDQMHSFWQPLWWGILISPSSSEIHHWRFDFQRLPSEAELQRLQTDPLPPRVLTAWAGSAEHLWMIQPKHR